MFLSIPSTLGVMLHWKGEQRLATLLKSSSLPSTTSLYTITVSGLSDVRQSDPSLQISTTRPLSSTTTGHSLAGQQPQVSTSSAQHTTSSNTPKRKTENDQLDQMREIKREKVMQAPE